MKKHKIKIWPNYFEAVLSGDKKHEIRINDRDYQVGDILKMNEVDPESGQYSGRYLSVRVTYTSVNQKNVTNYLRQKVIVMSIEVIGACHGKHKEPGIP